MPSTPESKISILCVKISFISICPCNPKKAMKSRRTKCYKEKQSHHRPIENTFLIKSDVNSLSGSNQTVEFKPIEAFINLPPKKETNLNNENHNVPFNRQILSEINEILQIISEFSELFKSKPTLQSTETHVIGNTECKSLFSDVLRGRIIEIGSSGDFIYNTNIKGKSGSLIFYTSDFKYAIKVIRNSELAVLRKNFDRMTDYCNKNTETFISKIFGVFTTSKIHFVIMNNVLKTPCSQIYDLKGSNVKRNFTGMNIEANWKGRRLIVRNKEQMLDAFRKDVEFLRSLNLMDYSILIGINEDEHTGFDVFDSKGRMIRHLDLTDVEYSLGIVDIFTEYTFYKRLESIFQVFCCCSGNKSSKNPHEYSERFLDLIENECFDEEDELN